MELQNFITQTLVSIVEGVRDAQLEVDEHHAQVNPYVLPDDIEDEEALGQTERGSTPRPVEFDVLVTASESEGEEGGAGIFVGGMGVGVRGEETTTTGHESRIKFKVPLVLPTHELTWNPDRETEMRYSVRQQEDEAS